MPRATASRPPQVDSTWARLSEAAVEAGIAYDADPARQHIAVAADEAVRVDRFALLGQGQHGGDASGLLGRQMRGVMPDITLRSGIGPVGADPRLRDVEIDFHDAALAPDRLDQHREP